MSLLRLGAGSELPAWIEALERRVFGDAWGPLDSDEVLWALPETAYARWRQSPVVGEGELLRIAVAPEARGQGLARRLLREGHQRLAAEGLETLFLEVRVSNAAARALYASEGWAEIGLRRAYYRDGEDAALYRRELP